MLTLFTAPKPFLGQARLHQRNALRSWLGLVPRPGILVFGDEPGIEEACAELGLRNCRDVEKSEFGTPLLSSVFRQAHRLSGESDLLAYSNADVVFLDDFPETIARVRKWSDRFLLVGRRVDIDADEELSLDGAGKADLRRLALVRGEPRDGWWIDYFVFPRGLWETIPPFAVGRPKWDNWMVFDAIRRGIPVVDATAAILALHQRHGYAHVPRARGHLWLGPEGDLNERLAGGGEAAYSIHDATHHVVRGRVRRRLSMQPLRRRWDRWERFPGAIGAAARMARRICRGRAGAALPTEGGSNGGGA